MSKVIIFPTDTVYGIGSPIYDKEGQERIYTIKHRDHSKPLAVLCANLEQIKAIAEVNEIAEKLINKFLPGAVTFILPAKEKVREIMQISTIGVRIPNSKLALSILEAEGPMATTSVNESGEKPLDTYEEICAVYQDKVEKIYKKTEPSSSLASTVIDVTGSNFKVLREGAITLKMVLDFVASLK